MVIENIPAGTLNAKNGLMSGSVFNTVSIWRNACASGLIRHLAGVLVAASAATALSTMPMRQALLFLYQTTSPSLKMTGSSRCGGAGAASGRVGYVGTGTGVWFGRAVWLMGVDIATGLGAAAEFEGGIPIEDGCGRIGGAVELATEAATGGAEDIEVVGGPVCKETRSSFSLKSLGSRSVPQRTQGHSDLSPVPPISHRRCGKNFFGESNLLVTLSGCP